MGNTALAASAAVAATPGASGAGVVQMLLGLVLVLLLVGGGAWLLKRLALVPGTGTGHIRVLAAASVGQRERVVLVQVADTWLLLGVAPGRVNMLHSLAKSEDPVLSPSEAPALPFSAWLQRMREARK